MKIETAIKKAMEGGYADERRKKYPRMDDFEVFNEAVDYISTTLLSPKFWQCLFKKRGHEMAVKFIDALFRGETAEQFFGKIEV